MATIKAKILRGVYIRGKAYPEGAVVELSPQEFQELKSSYYVTAPEKEETEKEDPKKGKGKE